MQFSWKAFEDRFRSLSLKIYGLSEISNDLANLQRYVCYERRDTAFNKISRRGKVQEDCRGFFQGSF